jgi:Flp pilus assembly protein TadG
MQRRRSPILNRLSSLSRDAAQDQSGSIMVGFAGSILGLAMVSGVAIDYSNASNTHSRLQSVADASALAGAREFRLGNANDAVLKQSVMNFAKAALGDTVATITPTVDLGNKTIAVSLTATIPTYLMHLAGKDNSVVTASAKAKMVGGAPICVIGLEQDQNATVEMDKSATLSAPNCSIYSNSKQSNGLVAKNYAVMKAAFICSAGGKSSPGPGSFSPEPKVDCPVLPDPLASRGQPTAGGCIGNNLVINGLMTALSPGTYCGGLTISNAAKVTLNPGVYIFRDGPLIVTGGATMTGVNVGLHFIGTGAKLRFDPASTISLTAPKTGDMAGMLISESKTNPVGQQFDILSNNARTLLGTIYLPNGRLHVAATAPVGDQSAYTIVVARRFTLSEGPTMVLNTNYSSSDIPVPAGVGPGGTTALIQ